MPWCGRACMHSHSDLTAGDNSTDQQSLQSCLRTGQPIEKRNRKKRTLTSHRTSFLFTKVAPFTLSHCIIITLKIGGENDVVWKEDITFESKSWYEIYIVQLLKGIFFLYYFFICEICDLSSLSWAVWLLENLLAFQEWSKRSLERSINFWKLTRLCIKFV